MGYPLQLSMRYINSKKGAFISVGTAFAIAGVALGVAALATVMSVTGGFQKEFRDKVLGVNAHVLVLKFSTDFREYREVMDKVSKAPGVIGVGPFIINPMMVSHGDKTATGVLLKGVDPDRMQQVLDLPRHIRQGSLEGLRRPGATPPNTPSDGSTGLLPISPTGPPQDSMSPKPDGSDCPFCKDEGKRTQGFMRSLREAIAEDDARAAQRDAAGAGTPAKANVPPPPAKLSAHDDGSLDSLGPHAPRGSIVPKGGYASALPEADVLPPDVAPDPCSSPDAVGRLPGIVVGATLAKSLGAGLGDCVLVTSPTIGYSFNQSSIRPPIAKQFRVIAVFEAGFDQYDSKLVYTDLYEAQGFYDQGDTVTGVEMKVSDIDNAKAIAASIDKMLANGLYHTMDWEELNHGLFTALRIQKISMSLVLALIIVVATFTVVATLIMIVLDKKKDVAILKAMGATDAAVLRTFLYQGAFIGGAGTTLGLVLGIIVCRVLLVYAFPLDPKVYFISHLPIELSIGDFLITGMGAIGICLFFTAFPALYAARLRPADGLRAQ